MACHGICTLSPRGAALALRFAKNMQHDTSKVLCVPREMTSEVSMQSVAPATKNAMHLLKMWQKYCACPTKRPLTNHETCWNVTKCHACHAKRSDAGKLQSDPLCRTYQSTGTAIATMRGHLRTVAGGCARLRTVSQRLANTDQPPHPQSETGTLATHWGKMCAPDGWTADLFSHLPEQALIRSCDFLGLCKSTGTWPLSLTRSSNGVPGLGDVRPITIGPWSAVLGCLTSQTGLL